jgi:hypothetical protein
MTALQTVPLPAEWVDSAVAESAIETASLLSDPTPRWLASTFDLPSTRAEILKGLAILSAVLVGAYFRRSGGRRVVLAAVAASTVVMGIVAVAHPLIGVDRVFGVYRPTETGHPLLLAPLMNGNNLGGFLAIGVPLLFGLALETRSLPVRSALISVGIGLATLTLATLSRGAVLSLGLGLFLLVGRLLWTRHGRRRSVMVVVGAAMVVVPVAALFLWSELAVTQLGSTNLDKIALNAAALSLASDHFILGVGRGAFSVAFVGIEGSDHRYIHPENVISQWVSEWGVPVAVVLSLGFAGLFVRAFRRATRSPARAAGIAAVGAAVGHNLWDFNLELVGVAAVVGLLMGAVLTFEESPPRRQLPVLRPVLAGAGVLTCVLALALGSYVTRNDLHAQIRSLRGSLNAGSSPASLRDAVERALRHHPSEPAFHLLAAELARRLGDPSTGRWLNRAMILAPHWPGPHRVAAIWLWTSGARQQALLEVRAAEDRVLHSASGLLCVWAKDGLSATEVGRAILPDGRGVAQLNELARCLPSDVAAEVDQMVLRRAPQATQPRLRQAARLSDSGRHREALAVLESAHGATPPEIHAIMLARAQTHLALNAPDAALALLTDYEPRAVQREPVLRLVATAAAASGDKTKMRDAVRRLRWLARGQADVLAGVAVFSGDLEQGLGEHEHAIAAYLEADRLAPASGALRRAAALYETTGATASAEVIWGQLCEREGSGSDACARARPDR